MPKSRDPSFGSMLTLLFFAASLPVVLTLIFFSVTQPGFFVFLAVLVLFPVLTAFWIAALLSCLKGEPSTGNDKVCWVIVIVFLNALGGLLYWFVRRPQRIRELGR